MALPSAPVDAPIGPAWKLIATGATLPYVWRIPLVVGTLLTAVNQGPRLIDGFQWSVWMAVAFNYLTPYVVSSLGFLAARRSARSVPNAQLSRSGPDRGV